MRRFYHATLFMVFSLTVSAQENIYLDEVFTDVSVSTNHVYGVNATILAFPIVGQAIPQPLVFDLYQATENTAALRPLLIYFHTGNFLPFPQNGGVNGTIRDSTVVTMAKKLARSGYVVASADYRLGWNPVAPSKDERVLTLINAAYRGVQDANTAIRFFKKSVVENGNPFRIDTSRIVLFGDGTGGYISLNTSALDAYIKIPTASNGKFLLSDGLGNFFPMILESVNGDIEGKKVGVIPPGGIPFLPFPVGDTLNYPNHVNYSSDFAASVNLGGAIGDSSWIDPGQPPIISVHVPYDPFAPYVEGLVVVPVNPPLEVVEVQGSYLVSYLSNLYGNNNVLSPPHNVTSEQFEVTAVANSRNDGLEGLFPIYGTGGPFDSAPWNFWDPATNVNSAAGLLQNPDMSKAKAELYMDSIIAYVLPRLYTSLDLATLVSTEDLLDPNDVQLATFPNPAVEEVFIATHKDYAIRSISVYDVKGTLVDSRTGINSNYYRLPVRQLTSGQYIIQVHFDQGMSARQIVIK
ncbi:MAG: T9SS type A sorting domain-containing protein [Bacteroidota bacterium]|nr:T9SS type A sorting domain-containing protein [Bacteroidota bacterium]